MIVPTGRVLSARTFMVGTTNGFCTRPRCAATSSRLKPSPVTTKSQSSVQRSSRLQRPAASALRYPERATVHLNGRSIMPARIASPTMSNEAAQQTSQSGGSPLVILPSDCVGTGARRGMGNASSVPAATRAMVAIPAGPMRDNTDRGSLAISRGGISASFRPSTLRAALPLRMLSFRRPTMALGYASLAAGIERPHGEAGNGAETRPDDREEFADVAL